MKNKTQGTNARSATQSKLVELPSTHRERRLKAAIWLWLLLGCLGQSNAATFTVTNCADSGLGTLRQALMDANANPGLDTIQFSLSCQTITPLTPLPSITDPVVIDGWTQPGFANKPLIELNGASAGTNANGLIIAG